jgi:predicted nucleotidyltransferase
MLPDPKGSQPNILVHEKSHVCAQVECSAASLSVSELKVIPLVPAFAAAKEDSNSNMLSEYLSLLRLSVDDGMQAAPPDENAPRKPLATDADGGHLCGPSSSAISTCINNAATAAVRGHEEAPSEPDGHNDPAPTGADAAALSDDPAPGASPAAAGASADRSPASPGGGVNAALFASFVRMWPALRPDSAARAQRAAAIAAVTVLLQASLTDIGEAGAAVRLFGSVACGLDLPSSDADFALRAGWADACAPEALRDRAAKLLRRLMDALRRRGLDPELVASARVPVVRFCWADLPCDVSVQRAGCERKTDLLLSAARADGRFRPLLRLLRHWARARGVNNAADGTLNSFTYALLTLEFLRMPMSSLSPPPLFSPPPLSSSSPTDRSEAAATGEDLRRGVEDDDGDSDAGAMTAAAVAVLMGPLLDHVQNRLERGRRAAPAGRGGLYVADPLDAGDNAARSLSADGAARLAAELGRARRILEATGDLEAACDPAAPAALPPAVAESLPPAAAVGRGGGGGGARRALNFAGLGGGCNGGGGGGGGGGGDGVHGLDERGPLWRGRQVISPRISFFLIPVCPVCAEFPRRLSGGRRRRRRRIFRRRRRRLSGRRRVGRWRQFPRRLLWRRLRCGWRRWPPLRHRRRRRDRWIYGRPNGGP